MSENPVHVPHAKNPKWVYAVGAALGAVIVIYWYRSNSAAKNAGTGTATVDTSSGYPVLTSDPLGSSSNPGTSPGSGSADYSTGSNSDWEQRAVAWLTTQGHGALDAQAAIETYLAGNPLTYAQGQTLNSVLAHFGTPPQGTQGPPIVGPKPVPAPAPAPVATAPRPVVKVNPPPQHVTVRPPVAAKPAYTLYTVQHGDTLSGIALRFYGHGTPAYYNKIAAANGIANPNRINAGQVLRIPR